MTALLLTLSLLAAPALLEVTARIPDAVVDLRYATADNFVGRKLYPEGARCKLLPEAVERLARAADRLREQGYRLVLYDCYRPHAVQWEMWRVFPREGYVADPRKGSNHNRGAAIDLSLARADGTPVEMPSPYDTFDRSAHHGYRGATAAARRHRELLLLAMKAAGFVPNRMEWWHYDLPGAHRHPVLDLPLTE